MTSDFRVCLDACVMANAGVNDLFLRLAERRLFIPRFSAQILEEVRHVHVDKFGWPAERADYWQEQVRAAFPDAIVGSYQQLIPACTNHDDDRHVLAAAIRGEAQLIVTYNLKHFQAKDLDVWDLRADHPQDYLITLYDMRPDVVLQTLHDIADHFGQGIEDRLSQLAKTVPMFAAHVRGALGL